MKKIDQKEIKNYYKYHRFAENVQRAIEDGNVEDKKLFYEIISENRYSKDFLEKISSEKEFKEIDAFLNNAFENRTPEEFRQKLDNMSLRKTRRVGIIKRTAAITAAAVVTVAFFLTCYLNFVSKKNGAVVESRSEQIKSPTLIVNNSRVIKLNEQSTKVIANDYASDSLTRKENADEILIQRLIVPSGYTFTVVLNDSTTIRLNAESELSYPSRFSGDKREVHLKGEAYFDVTKSEIPFQITTDDGACVRVYGTRFNVNARTNTKMKAILVEGSIGVGMKGHDEIKMIPNQMLVLNTVSGAYSISEVVPDQMIGWIYDLFLYKEAPMKELINDLSAWYGIDFIYNEKQFENVKITISLERGMHITDMFEFLEKILNVKFIQEGGNLYRIVVE